MLAYNTAVKVCAGLWQHVEHILMVVQHMSMLSVPCAGHSVHLCAAWHNHPPCHGASASGTLGVITCVTVHLCTGCGLLARLCLHVLCYGRASAALPRTALHYLLAILPAKVPWHFNNGRNIPIEPLNNELHSSSVASKHVLFSKLPVARRVLE